MPQHLKIPELPSQGKLSSKYLQAGRNFLNPASNAKQPSYGDINLGNPTDLLSANYGGTNGGVPAVENTGFFDGLFSENSNLIPGIEAFSGVADAYLGFENLSLAKDQFNLGKDQYNRQLANTGQSYNTQLGNDYTAQLLNTSKYKNEDGSLNQAGFDADLNAYLSANKVNTNPI